MIAAASQSRSRSLLPAILLALNTGLRRGEVAGLQWSQIDLDARRLTVGKAKTRAGSGRRVPLNEKAFTALSAWAAVPLPQAHALRLPDGAIRRRRSRSQLRPGERSVSTFQVAWRGAKKRTADEEKQIPAVVCRWHDLRHTFCTRMLEGGQNLPLLAAIMGWSAGTTIRMARRYGHFSDESLSAAVAVLDDPKPARN